MKQIQFLKTNTYLVVLAVCGNDPFSQYLDTVFMLMFCVLSFVPGPYIQFYWHVKASHHTFCFSFYF